MNDLNAEAPKPDAAAERSIAAIGARVSCGLLALIAYRKLLWFQPERALSDELEQWFFVPSTTITPVVMLIGLWLLYRRSARLRSLPQPPGSLAVGIALLGAAAGLYGWATYTAANDLLVPSLMLSGLACGWLWKGGAGLRLLLVPVGILVFAMPLPAPVLNALIFPLQIATTEMAGTVLYLLDVPHFVAGERILRAEATFSVIEACSGLRSMETLVMVAILMMDLFRRRGWRAWLVVLAAFPVAFLLNGLRAVLLILNPHSQLAAVHNVQGVAILLAGLVLLFLLDGLLERRAQPAASGALAGQAADAGRAEAVGQAKAAGHAAAAGQAEAAGVVPPLGATGAVALSMGLLVAVSVWLPQWDPGERPPLDLSRRMASAMGFYLSSSVDTDFLFLGSTGFSDSFSRRFELDGSQVEFFMGVGDRARRQRSALSPKTSIPGSGWIIEGEDAATLEPDGRGVRSRVLRQGSHRYLVYDWVEGSRSWPIEGMRSLLALDRSPLRDTTEIVSLRITVRIEEPVSSGRQRAETEILRFYRSLRPQLDRKLDSRESGALGKRFSGFSGFGKSFSFLKGSWPGGKLIVFNDLGCCPKSARDLLLRLPEAVLPLGGVQVGSTRP